MDKSRIVELLKEPSTYAGLGLILAAVLGLPVGSGEQVGVLLAGIASVYLKEKGSDK
jgi:hypothetical protein